MKALTAAILLLLILSSCANRTGDKILPKPAFRQGPLDTIYAKLRPAVQTFSIDNSKANTVKAANGTEILVPAGCFVNSYGEKISGAVEIKIVEAFSLQDFITSGLSTVSDNRLLLSNGMMYINASAGDEPLKLDKGASLTVSMPTMGSNGGYQMFTGDGSNWKPDSSMQETGYTITLPLDLLYPEGNKFYWHCYETWDGPNEKIAYYDTNVVSVTDKRYENTVIATDEFIQRLWQLRHMMNYMSFFINRDYYFHKTDCYGEKYNYDIFKVYYDNPNRSFRESDSIAKKMYIDYFTENEQKMLAFCNEVNVFDRTYYSNWTDTNYTFDFRKRSLKEQYMDVLKYFPPADAKEIKRINDHGVDLDAANAYELLKAKKVAAEEINDLLDYAFRRRAIIRQLQKRKAELQDKQKLSGIYESTVFSVRTMGWINCDRFYDDPEAGKAEIYVSSSPGNNFNFIDCSLVIPGMNVRLTGYPGRSGNYSFTQSNGMYTKLPIGRDAVIVGVAIQHDSVFFASKKIKIKDGLNIALPMKYTTVSGLKDSLAVVLK